MKSTWKLYLQQDGTSDHASRLNLNTLRAKFGHPSISRIGAVKWQPRSCGLMPLDYFLCIYVKSKVYVKQLVAPKELEDNIQRT